MRWFRKWRNRPSTGYPDELMNYIVNTAADGQLSDTGIFKSSDAQLKRMVQNIVCFFKAHPGTNRLVFYCHGGLVSEKVAGDGIKDRYKTFLDNHVYPVFFIWQSSFQEALEDHLRETIHERFREMSPIDRIVDEVIEEAAKLFPEPWEAMKRRGEQVFASHGGGWKFFMLLAKGLRKENLQAEVHLVGHSAGSIVLAALLKQLLEGNGYVYPYLKMFTCTLYAPASTVQQFEDVYARAMDRYCLKRFFLYTLSDELETSDPSVPFYGKSMLYLISRGLEAQHGDQPIFGMEIYAKNSPSLQRMIGSKRGAWIVADVESRPVLFPTGTEVLELISMSRVHAGFSYDPVTLNSTLRTILNRNKLLEEFK
ncbi:hypothetical protein [Effusibacillus consociatus]|uniref:Fungal lipase-like domain-containing protein n=1 Tax=Effusibacillus consociatus TaxID=1117041 RepID=A0ABV9PYB2_9BACL